MMLVEERYKKIMELLRENTIVRTPQLAELFGVSGETIRRDLDYLEAEGLLKKIYGGAVLETIDSSEPRFADRESQFHSGKLEVAKLACGFVSEGQSIALDVSTTNLEIARELKKRFQRLTILTNSIAIAAELADAPGYDVILTGGRVNGAQMAVTGEMCISNLRQYNIDLYFMSTNGISLRAGITDFGFGEVEAKRVMAQISQRRILVSISNRFDVVSLLKVAELSDVELIITDSMLKKETEHQYSAYGVKIVKPDA